MYRGTKKDVEQEYVYFSLTWAQKIKKNFVVKNASLKIYLKKHHFFSHDSIFLVKLALFDTNISYSLGSSLVKKSVLFYTRFKSHMQKKLI